MLTLLTLQSMLLACALFASIAFLEVYIGKIIFAVKKESYPHKQDVITSSWFMVLFWSLFYFVVHL